MLPFIEKGLSVIRKHDIQAGEKPSERIVTRFGHQEVYVDKHGRIARIKDVRKIEDINQTIVQDYRYLYDPYGDMIGFKSARASEVNGPAISTIHYIDLPSGEVPVISTYYDDANKIDPGSKNPVRNNPMATAWFHEPGTEGNKFTLKKTPDLGYNPEPFIPGSYSVLYQDTQRDAVGGVIHTFYDKGQLASRHWLVNGENEGLTLEQTIKALSEYTVNGSLPEIIVPRIGKSDAKAAAVESPNVVKAR